MRHHKLALCKEHFLEWLPAQVQRFIEKYEMFTPQERVLVAVSGGKDLLSLWDILWRLGYNSDGVYINLGIDGGIGYSAESRRLTEGFAAERNLFLHIVDLGEDYKKTIPELSELTRRGKEKPCSICGLMKRHIMNCIAHDGSYNVLVTGHNLDDETATMLGNTLNWITGYLIRQSPVLEAGRSGLVRKAKPLCRIYERDMAAYALLRGINYIQDECPYSEGSNSIFYKDLLNQLEAKKPGAKTNFYTAFLKAKKNGMFTAQADPDYDNLHPCPRCGQPTSSVENCTFCRIISSVQG